MNISDPLTYRLALSVTRSSISFVFGAANGSESQAIWPAAVSGISIGSGIGLSAGKSKGVPSGITPAPRRKANLLCWARSLSISNEEKPQG